MSVLYLTVKLTSTEPPPDWEAKQLKRVQREFELLYGDNAEVTKMVNPDPGGV